MIEYLKTRPWWNLGFATQALTIGAMMTSKAMLVPASEIAITVGVSGLYVATVYTLYSVGRAVWNHFYPQPIDESLPVTQTYEDGITVGHLRGHALGLTEGNRLSGDDLQASLAASFQQGREAGLKEGREVGLKEGREVGLKEGQTGLSENYEAGYDAGYEAGRDVGLKESQAGLSENYDAGYDAGYEEGRDVGHGEGYEKGHNAGYAAGLQDSLRQMLESGDENQQSDYSGSENAEPESDNSVYDNPGFNGGYDGGYDSDSNGPFSPEETDNELNNDILPPPVPVVIIQGPRVRARAPAPAWRDQDGLGTMGNSDGHRRSCRVKELPRKNYKI